MCNTFMAIDTGLTLLKAINVLFHRPSTLLHVVHGFVIMAVATLPRIGLLHLVPDVLCQHQSFRFKFLRRIDAP